ncbi:MAG TPA: Gfo/Idh/MocA family oxidoreductase [Chloroflexota bacterium]|nr:Gfo/Idh/MocA family oxidoreductase [Chloroflexota bacterium]
MDDRQGHLRIGFLGSGFIAQFHLQALESVRNCTVAGVYSPSREHRESLAVAATDMGLGPCTAFESAEAMLESGKIDAVWILGPNDTRLEHMRLIHQAVTRDGVALRGVACEKPLARTLAEARDMLRLVREAALNHGYLENQVFATAVRRGKDIIWRRGVPNSGRPYLARASEEHSGPHMPWFWRGDRQGGGVLSDMMCHSVEVARFLLTEPGADRRSLRLKSANATVANLKWTRPAYAARLRQTMGAEVDYSRYPAEDFARGTLVLEDSRGEELIIEASTSWAYVGPGLRIQIELLGPEYAMEINTLNTDLKVFFSRQIQGSAGEDLVEKQNAEQGLMPVLEDEAAIYGYTLEDRHMVESFLRGETPLETFEDGVAVVEMLMALYRSAEAGRTVTLPDETLETYIPAVARRG